MENSIVRSIAMKWKFILNSGQLSIKQPTTSSLESLKTKRTMPCDVGNCLCFIDVVLTILIMTLCSVHLIPILHLTLCHLGFWVEKKL